MLSGWTSPHCICVNYTLFDLLLFGHWYCCLLKHAVFLLFFWLLLSSIRWASLCLFGQQTWMFSCFWKIVQWQCWFSGMKIWEKKSVLCFIAYSSCTPTRGQSDTRSSGSHSDDGSNPADCRGPPHPSRGIHRAAFTWAPALSLHWETPSDILCSESTPRSNLDQAWPAQTRLIPAFGTHSINRRLTNSVQPWFVNPLMAHRNTG